MLGYGRFIRNIGISCKCLYAHSNGFLSSASFLQYTPYRRCMVPRRRRWIDLSENVTEGGPGLKHRSDVEVPAHLPDPLTNACHVWKVGYGGLLGFVVVRLSECSLLRS